MLKTRTHHEKPAGFYTIASADNFRDASAADAEAQRLSRETGRQTILMYVAAVNRTTENPWKIMIKA